jgi:hypothetical protein
MEFIGPLSSSDLEKAAARFYPEGIEGYVDVALLLQELNQVAKQIAGARVQESFHTQERSLYEPMKALLERHLPSNGLVHVENLLYKTAEPGKKTDLSIGCVWHKGKDRLFADLHCTHFIELKSMFAGETLARADVLDDLAKLLECERAYIANCFFVLVGHETRIRKSRFAWELAQQHGRNKCFETVLPAGDVAHLRPAGAYLAENPYVYVFEVSASETKLKSARRSGIRYAIFQGK